MSRSLFACGLLTALITIGCTKSAPKDNGSGADLQNGTADKVVVPGGDVPPPRMGVGSGESVPATKGASDDSQKLAAEEGKLAIEQAAEAKVGAEAVARITVTPGTGYHVNTEFPTKLTLTAPEGITLAKAEFKAGGSSKDKGDIDVFEESQLLLGVKYTAAKRGSYTISGTFKFAVCDKDSCRPKKESIAIQVAVK